MIRGLLIAALSLWVSVAQAQMGQIPSYVTPPASASSCCVLDGITTGIKAAYSTRKLLTAYAGNAMQIERASDSTTQNIGFVSNVLDTGSVSSFCTGTTCTVITWYDQSGGGFNLTPISTSAITIYASGAVQVINSTRPALNFPGGTNNSTLTNSSLFPNPVNTLFMNAVVVSPGTNDDILIYATTGGSNLAWRVDGTSLDMELVNPGVASLGTATIAQNASGSVLEVQYNSSTGAGSFWVDRAAAGTFTTSTSFTGGVPIAVGFDNGNMASKTGELIMYDLVGGIPSGSRTTIENNQKTYWGTP